LDTDRRTPNPELRTRNRDEGRDKPDRRRSLPGDSDQYDCGGRTDEKTPLESTIEMVSGKLSCAEVRKEP
jgi:hypothetical protein